MLRFQAATLAAWRERIHSTYHDRLIAFVQRNLPEHDGDDLPERTRAAAARGSTWGLADEHSVGTYVVLAVIYGPRFDDEAWAWTHLTDERRRPAERIQAVFAAAVRRATTVGTPLAARDGHEP